MKIMAYKVHDKPPEGIIMQMRLLPALCAVIVSGMKTTVGANYRFVVVRHNCFD